MKKEDDVKNVAISTSEEKNELPENTSGSFKHVTENGAADGELRVKKLTPESLTGAYIFFMLTVYPLAVGAEGYGAITSFKYVLLLIISGIYLLGIGILSLMDGRLFKITTHPSGILAGLFVLVSLISALLSPYGFETCLGMGGPAGLLNTVLYGACFVCVLKYGSAKPYHLIGYAISMTLFCLISSLQLCGLNPFWLYPQGLNYYGGNSQYAGVFLGTLGNAGLAGALLCASTGIFAASILCIKGRIKWLLVAPFAFCLGILLLTKSAAGLVATFFGLLIIFPICLRANRKKAVCAALIILLLSGIVVFAYSGENRDIAEASAVLHGEVEKDFGSGRVQIWKEALRVIQDNPLLGSGPGTFALATEINFERLDEEKNAMIVAKVTTAHNEYINIAVNEGLVGLAIYLSLIATVLVAWIRNSRNSAAAICGAAVCCYIIQAFFGITSFIVFPIMIPLAALAAKNAEQGE